MTGYPGFIGKRLVRRLAEQARSRGEKLVVLVRAKDAAAARAELARVDGRVELMEGDCDWPSVMKALREVGYSGYINAEVKGGKRDRLAKIAALMDKIIAS